LFLVPLLQAETDRDFMRRLQAAKERESRIMGPNWSPLDLNAPLQGLNPQDALAREPVYHSAKHYVPPHYFYLPSSSEGESFSFEKIQAQWWRGSKMFTKVCRDPKGQRPEG
jgi:hypothetical protein